MRHNAGEYAIGGLGVKRKICIWQRFSLLTLVRDRRTSKAHHPVEEKDMDISKLTIGEAREIAKMFAAVASQPATQAASIDGGGRKVIVRSRDAGVLFGELSSYTQDGALVHLRNARQMWSWTAKEGGTLLDCATHGVMAGKMSTVNEAVTVIGACAIIDVTDKAAKTLESASWA